jgi:hypothetical protein
MKHPNLHNKTDYAIRPSKDIKKPKECNYINKAKPKAMWVKDALKSLMER